MTINNNKTIGRVRVGQNKPTNITDPNRLGTVNISLGELTDVTDSNLANGHVLIYNAASEKYEVSSSKNLEISNISGGNF
jgi:hypothetical protein